MIGSRRVSEEVRMPPPHLLFQCARDCGGVELALFLPDYDLKREVQQQVAQLVTQLAGSPCLSA